MMPSLKLYRDMYLIRRCEETLIQEYPTDQVRTPLHQSRGAEAIAAGVCGALAPEDQVLTSYRSHAVYLAKTGDVDGFFGELYGKVTGPLQGRGGSMHLADPASGHMVASAVVASHIPMALGLAFANQRLKNGRVVAVFFGDGALDEGVFWESLNLACLWQLPVIFVCEDNGLSVQTPTWQRQGYDDLLEVVSGFNCGWWCTTEDDATDVEAIFKGVTEALEEIRKGRGPQFLWLKYFRYLEHVGIGYDWGRYHPESEYHRWLAVDPLDLQRGRLLDRFSLVELEAIDRGIDAQVAVAVQQAKAAPFGATAGKVEGLSTTAG